MLDATMTAFLPDSLNGLHASYSDLKPVWHITTKVEYRVLFSFFLLNSERNYIICYALLKVGSQKEVVYCPSTFLIDVEPKQE
jgi:hypothetical protein